MREPGIGSYLVLFIAFVLVIILLIQIIGPLATDWLKIFAENPF